MEKVTTVSTRIKPNCFIYLSHLSHPRRFGGEIGEKPGGGEGGGREELGKGCIRY